MIPLWNIRWITFGAESFLDVEENEGHYVHEFLLRNKRGEYLIQKMRISIRYSTKMTKLSLSQKKKYLRGGKHYR